MKFRKLLTIALLLISGALIAQTKPNVVIIYTDDQGSRDLQSYGATDLITPNMDKIVNGGVRFTQFYAQAICSPSRASLLTGKNPQHAGVPGNIPSVPVTSKGLKGEQYTMAEMFKDAGYQTVHIGKWHLGDQEGMLPNEQGFDYSFGHHVGCIDNFSHFYYWRGPNRHDLYRNGKEVFYDGQFFPDLMLKEAKSFLDNMEDKPFFMFYAMNSPHYPYQGTLEWLNYYREKGVVYPRDLYAAFLSTHDEIIGDLLKKLEDLKLMENTIIVFQSDNGHSTEERAHHGGGNAGPYRGAKQCLFEGGIRVPAAIAWKNKLPAGQVRDQFAVNADWMPTLAELCGIQLDTETLDGKSLIPVINNSQSETMHRDGYCWQLNDMWVARKGKWKLIGNPYDTSMRDYKFTVDRWLVNLEKDPGETTNLAEKYPKVLAELEKQFSDWQENNKSN
ncbi:sulfatase family protein [Marinifilum caeruleilacunae]|uniref:Sulfatase n=1 Tax=Marinifilum caeruleilacunae TaxID=2499076 RepID=A0ABX1WYR5_9BACT|nr:sulfatase-like hydrolase/transferase [Marinifilum caeruleilacunae]NOU61288.1 sulfatase [Marinifilum caeruleilacunae]